MSAARTKKKRQRTHRYTSNVFSMFNQEQIQEFKEAFNMIDQNRDGFVDKDDLIEMLTSLGKNPDDQFLDGMINEAPGPINFTMFLTLFGEKLNGTDPEEVIRNAFGCFDLTNKGIIPEDRLREIMTTMGDRWSDDRVDELFYGAPIQNGLFDYIEFTRTLKHGAKDKDEEAPLSTPSTPSTPRQKAPTTPNDKVPTTPKKLAPPTPKSQPSPTPKLQAPPIPKKRDLPTQDANHLKSKDAPPSLPSTAPPIPKKRDPPTQEANHQKPKDSPPSPPTTAPPKNSVKAPNVPSKTPPKGPSKPPFGANLKTTGALKKF